MITVASRLFLGIAVLGGVGAVVYVASAGDRTGTILLLSLLVGAATAGLATTSRRDRETELADLTVAATGEATPIRRERDEHPAAGSSVWPLGAAIGAGLVAVGAVVGEEYVGIGLGVLALVAIGWYGQSWRQDNAESYGVLRGRLLLPVVVPLVAFLVVGGLVVPASRILLAVDKNASVVIAIAVATLVLVVASVIAARPAVLSSGLVTGLLLLAGVGLISGGIVAAAVGERDFEAHASDAGHGHMADHGEGEEEDTDDPAVEEDEDEADSGAEVPGDEAAEATEVVEVVAEGLAFDVDTITVPADTDVIIRLENEDQSIPHNISVYEDKGGETIFEGAVFNGRESRDYEFTSPAAGTYWFQCDVHPNMNGDFVTE